jgi:RNA polymerase sigma factor (TIGR02999 family)
MESNDPSPGEVTELLHRSQRGDKAAEERLFEIVTPRLLRIARHLISGERKGHSLRPTVLVNEIYIRFAGMNVNWRDRQHFFRLAARAMRRYLIDYFRKYNKRQRLLLPLDGLDVMIPDNPQSRESALTIDQLLAELETLSPEQCMVVEVKFYLGLTDEEAAEALHMPLRTVQRKWLEARLWLFKRANHSQKHPDKKPARRVAHSRTGGAVRKAAAGPGSHKRNG